MNCPATGKTCVICPLSPLLRSHTCTDWSYAYVFGNRSQRVPYVLALPFPFSNPKTINKPWISFFLKKKNKSQQPTTQNSPRFTDFCLYQWAALLCKKSRSEANGGGVGKKGKTERVAKTFRPFPYILNIWFPWATWLILMFNSLMSPKSPNRFCSQTFQSLNLHHCPLLPRLHQSALLTSLCSSWYLSFLFLLHLRKKGGNREILLCHFWHSKTGAVMVFYQPLRREWGVMGRVSMLSHPNVFWQQFCCYRMSPYAFCL